MFGALLASQTGADVDEIDGGIVFTLNPLSISSASAVGDAIKRFW